MATAKLTVSLRWRDTAAMKLLMLQLQFLRDEMVIAASPFAGEMDKIIDRFTSAGDDDGYEPEPGEQEIRPDD